MRILKKIVDGKTKYLQKKIQTLGKVWIVNNLKIIRDALPGLH